MARHRFRSLAVKAVLCGVCTGPAFGYNTAGSMLHINSADFNHPNLKQLTWTAHIDEYDHIPAAPDPFRIRIEFNSVGFTGSAGSCSVGAMIQNVRHEFEDDIVGSAFAQPPTIAVIPDLGLYFSALRPAWADSGYGVALRADPTEPPSFGRVFEDVDAIGNLARNIYTREPLEAVPLEVMWSVSKGLTVTNPVNQLAKDWGGSWVQLNGTFVIWRFSVRINGTPYSVADYYLPIEYAEYIRGWDPLVLHQEYFGAAEGILDAQKGSVTYSDMWAFDGSNAFPLDSWILTWRIDDGAGNNDERFGWLSDGTTLTSRVGHETDTQCVRDPGNTFVLGMDEPPLVQTELLDIVTTCDGIELHWPTWVGHKYYMEYADDLCGTNWTAYCSPVSGFGRPICQLLPWDVLPHPVKGFFRLRITTLQEP